MTVQALRHKHIRYVLEPTLVAAMFPGCDEDRHRTSPVMTMLHLATLLMSMSVLPEGPGRTRF